VIPHRRGRTVWVELRIVTADKLSIEIVGQCLGRSLSTGVVRNGLIKFQIEELSPGAIYHHSEKPGACLALVLSALVTLFGEWDAFFNHRALWIRYTKTRYQLIGIKSELE
jgi:hypothetical protein